MGDEGKAVGIAQAPAALLSVWLNHIRVAICLIRRASSRASSVAASRSFALACHGLLAKFSFNLLRRCSLHAFDKSETAFTVFPFLLETLGFAAAVFAKCDIKGDFTCKLGCQPMSKFRNSTGTLCHGF
jgi:hypothetical protein